MLNLYMNINNQYELYKNLNLYKEIQQYLF